MHHFFAINISQSDHINNTKYNSLPATQMLKFPPQYNNAEENETDIARRKCNKYSVCMAHIKI